MLVIAIDGPAGVGKSTIARRLAKALRWAYLDSGAMYRAVTWVALTRGIPLEDHQALASLTRGLELVLDPDGTVRVDGVDVTDRIRTHEVTEGVSIVARVPAVREVMVSHQRGFAGLNGRVVAEGRDIGTVVFPDAALKIYLDAGSDERAERRLAQLGEGAEGRDVAAIKAGIEQRDRMDRTRSVAPLRAAEDAWHLDTSEMTLDEVFGAVHSRVRSAVRP